jgi:hypothetical protein
LSNGSSSILLWDDFLFSEDRKFKTVGKWTKFYYDDAALYRETQRPMLIPIKNGEL